MLDRNVAGSAVRQDMAATSADHRASVLFQTRFKNNTKADQSYTMKTEKKTRTSMTTSVEHGFTKGIEMGLLLKTPGEVANQVHPLSPPLPWSSAVASRFLTKQVMSKEC